MFLLLKYTLLYTVVLMMVALGGMFSERSGIINIALEGIMVIGGLMGVVMINIMNALGVPVFLAVIICVLASGLAGMVYSSLLAFSAIFISHITVGGGFMTAKLFPSEVSNIISGVVIYLCAFSLLFRTRIQRLFVRKPKAPGKEDNA